MLDELRVSNLGVLEEAHLEPGEGFTVVTGETGAGKTLLLGALRLLLGRAADSDLVGPFGEEALVEGRLLRHDGSEVAAGRRLTRKGRSRAYLDGSIASAPALDEATEGLVEIIGQHDHLTLTRPSEVRALVDRQLDDDGLEAWRSYRKIWEELAELEADRDRLGGDRRALERERELALHQTGEIKAAGLDEDEERELETRIQRLRHAEELAGFLAETDRSVDRARERLGEAVANLRRAGRLDPSLGDLSGELEALESRLGDQALEVTRTIESLDADPGELDHAEERFRTLLDLRRKYGASLAEVLAFGEKAATRAAEIEALLSRADALDDEIASAQERLEQAAAALGQARTIAAQRLCEEAITHLRQLGFGSPVLTPEIEPAEPGPSGADSVRLAFASDERLTPGDLGKVASGGELSRLVLALRLAGGSDTATTLVFDEVDAGVGGATALALGRKLGGLAADRQVLCVTHLPQLAAFADVHYVVRREGDRAVVERVEGEARIGELSRMLAGLPESDRGRDAAEELLALAGDG